MIFQKIVIRKRVNSADEISEQKFTIAHELGHCVMHRPNDSELKQANDRQSYTQILYRQDISAYTPKEDKQEREADEFAYNLLLPDKIFEKCFKLFKGNVDKLSEIFQVSDCFILKKIKDMRLL